MCQKWLKLTAQGPISLRPWQVSHPENHSKTSNLTITDWAVLFTYSSHKQRFPLYKKFQAHTCTYTSTFLDTDELKMALWTQKVSRPFKKQARGPLFSNLCKSISMGTSMWQMEGERDKRFIHLNLLFLLRAITICFLWFQSIIKKKTSKIKSSIEITRYFRCTGIFSQTTLK